MPQVTFTLEAQEAAAVNAFLKVVDAQKKMEEGGRRIKSAHDQANDSLLKIGQAGKDMLAVFGLGGGLISGLNAMVSTFRDMRAEMTNIADQSSKMRREITAFAIMQDPGTRKQMMARAGQLAQEEGVTLGTAMNAIQAAQSMPGKNQQSGFETGRTLVRGDQLGMDPDQLAGFMNALTRKGEPDSAAIMLPFLAGKASYKTPEDMMRMKEALPFWDDPVLMAAAAPEVLSATSEGEFQTYLKNAGMALQISNKDTNKLWKELGLTNSSSHIEKLKSLKKAGITDPEQLQHSGFGEKRELIGLYAILNGLDRIQLNRSDWAGKLDKKTLDGIISGLRNEVPQVDFALRQASEAARKESAQVLGAGPANQARDIAMRSYANQFEPGSFAESFYTTGQGADRRAKWWVSESTMAAADPAGRRNLLMDRYRIGKLSSSDANELARIAANEMGSSSPYSGSQITSSIFKNEGGGGLFSHRVSDDLLSRLVSALEANTQATLDNSKQGARPGAPASRDPNRERNRE